MIKTQQEIIKIEHKLNSLYEKLLEKRPSHFRTRDIVNAFFASLLFGLTFIFKGALIQIALTLKPIHNASELLHILPYLY